MVVLPALKPACSLAVIFAACGCNLLSVIISMTFARMADEIDCSVGLAMNQVAFLGKYDGQGLGPQGWSFSCLPVLVKLG